MKSKRQNHFLPSFHLISIAFIFVMIYACHKDKPISNKTDSHVSVDLQSVKLIAIQNFQKLHPELNLEVIKKTTNEEMPFIDTSFILQDKKGRNAIYFFRYLDNKGWNIISGDNRFFPVLAYNAEGNSKLDTSLNPGLKYWVDDIFQQIDFMDNNNIFQSDAIKYEWIKYLSDSLNHLKNEPPDPGGGCTVTYNIWAYPGNNNLGFTGLKWGQTAGFNHYMAPDYCEPHDYFCNKYPAGCGPVAIGMIMKYYQRPINYNANGTNKTAIYNIMPDSIYWGYVNCANPSIDEKEIASLLRYASGKYAQLWCFTVAVPFYYSSKSATALHPNKIKQTFADFGYSNSGNKIDYSGNFDRLIDNLKLRKPVIFSGSNCDICFWNAHIWLCEGLKEYVSETCSVYDCVFMNWGWNALDNGWYGLSNSYAGGGTVFNNANMKIVVDIKP